MVSFLAVILIAILKRELRGKKSFDRIKGTSGIIAGLYHLQTHRGE
jgi:hypothetical protein